MDLEELIQLNKILKKNNIENSSKSNYIKIDNREAIKQKEYEVYQILSQMPVYNQDFTTISHYYPLTQCKARSTFTKYIQNLIKKGYIKIQYYGNFYANYNGNVVMNKVNRKMYLMVLDELGNIINQNTLNEAIYDIMEK